MLTLETFPETTGKVIVNSIGVKNFPWQGVYFEKNPVTLQAIPKSEYVFKEWQLNGKHFQKGEKFAFNLEENQRLKAVFDKAEN